MIQKRTLLPSAIIVAFLFLGVGMVNVYATSDGSVTINSPADNSFTNSASVSITGSSSAGTGTFDAANPLTYTLDGGPSTNATTFNSGDGSYTIDLSGLSDATHTVVVTELDSQGSNQATVNFTVDTTNPTSTINSPADNSFSNSATVNLSGTSSDANLASTQISVDGGALQATSGTAASWTYSATGLSDGPHTFQTTATDLAGNTATSSVITVTVDTTNPVISITAPSNGTTTGNPIVHVTGTASDTNLSLVEVSVDGGAFTAATGTTSWTFDTSSLSNGVHTIDARATDSAGNVQSATQVSVTVDNTVPVVNITAPADNSFSNNAIVHVTGTATDGISGIASVQVSVDGGAYNTATTSDGFANWTFDTSSLSEGSHTLQAKVTGTNAIVGTSSIVNITIDTTNPTISITAPANATVINTASVHVTGTASDTNLSLVEVSVDGGAFTAATGTTSWTFDTSSLSNGVHTIDARATDSAGNVQSATQVSVTVDNTSPLVTITDPIDGSTLTNKLNFNVTGTASDGVSGIASVQVSVNGSAFTAATTSDGFAHWSYGASVTGDGPFTVTAKVTGVNSLVGTSTINLSENTVVYYFKSGGYASAVPSLAVPSFGGANVKFHDGLNINGRSFDISKFFQEIPKQQFAINKEVQIVVKQVPLYGSTDYSRTSMYMNFGNMEMNPVNAQISLSVDKSGSVKIVDPNGFMKNVHVTTEQVDENVLKTHFLFTPTKPMPDTSMMFQSVDGHNRVNNVKVLGAIQFGIDAPVVVKQDPNTIVMNDIATVQKYLSDNYYQKPELIAHIHDSAAVFGNTGGNVYWTVNTSTKTLTLHEVDRDGNEVFAQSTALIEQPLHPKGFGQTTQDHMSNSYQPSWMGGSSDGYVKNSFIMPANMR